MKQKLRVLVVDDQPAILHTYTLILQQHDYDVTAAATFGEAAQDLLAESYDLLLCDYSLDEGHFGFDLIDLAAARSPQTRSLLLTGYPSQEVTDGAASRGTVLLSKPVEVPSLLRHMSELAAGKQLRTQAVAGATPSAAVVHAPRSFASEVGS